MTVAGDGDVIPELLGVLVTQCQVAGAGVPRIDGFIADEDAVAEREMPRMLTVLSRPGTALPWGWARCSATCWRACRACWRTGSKSPATWASLAPQFPPQPCLQPPCPPSCASAPRQCAPASWACLAPLQDSFASCQAKLASREGGQCKRKHPRAPCPPLHTARTHARMHARTQHTLVTQYMFSIC